MESRSTAITSLDDPERFGGLASKIKSKPALMEFYRNIYLRYKNCISAAPREGLAIEFGSGAGFAKELLPELITSDVISYEGVDLVLDVQKLNLEDSKIRAAFFVNVLHHVPDVEKMFSELSRTLMEEGKILIIDQYPGFPAKWIYQYAHHEPFDLNAKRWQFCSTGPLSGANGALAWIVFFRDRGIFEKNFPHLRIDRVETFSPFYYWLSGGLKDWTLIPNFMVKAVWVIDQFIGRKLPFLCSFVAIEISKRKN